MRTLTCVLVGAAVVSTWLISHLTVHPGSACWMRAGEPPPCSRVLWLQVLQTAGAAASHQETLARMAGGHREATRYWTSNQTHNELMFGGILPDKCQKTRRPRGAVQVPPRDVPGVSQGLPELVLLRGGLFAQQLDTLGRQQRNHDGHRQTHRRVGGHLGRRRTSRQTRPREMDQVLPTCSLTNANMEKKWWTYSGAVGFSMSPFNSA